MKLWLLHHKDGMEVGYDCALGFVVRAASESDARVLANNKGGMETAPGHDAWLDPSATTCKPLVPSGEPGVIMCDFLNG